MWQIKVKTSYIFNIQICAAIDDHMNSYHLLGMMTVTVREPTSLVFSLRFFVFGEAEFFGYITMIR